MEQVDVEGAVVARAVLDIDRDGSRATADASAFLKKRLRTNDCTIGTLRSRGPGAEEIIVGIVLVRP